MSKKDYELIAKTIREFYNMQDINHTSDVEPLAHYFAVALADTNERFDVDRFLKACGVQN